MNLPADESVDRQIVDLLRTDGHAVRYIAEIEPGISDDIVLDMAYQETDLLLTADKDFGELVFRQGRLTNSPKSSWCSAKVGSRPASSLFDWRVYHLHARQRSLLMPLISIAQNY